MAAADTPFDPFGSVRKLQGLRGGEGDAPDFQHAYGQKLQSLQEQMAARKQDEAMATQLAQLGVAAKAAPSAMRSNASPSTRATRNPDTGGLAAPSTANRALGERMAAAMGWTGAQWDAFDRLVMKESGWNSTAQNPTSSAYGIGQFLNSTWGPYGSKTSDPSKQIDYMLRYVKSRYGDPSAALQFHLANNYY